jgi:hypothetical protein
LVVQTGDSVVEIVDSVVEIVDLAVADNCNMDNYSKLDMR